MVSKKNIKTLIDQSDLSYQKCWNALCLLKKYDKAEESVTKLMDFQITLTESLFKLSQMHDAIIKEKKNVEGRINNLSKEWFVNRLKTLRAYSDTIDSTIAIGKSLGDAFAWFWYKNELEHYQEHLNHKDNFYMPTGIGGVGELEFVRNIKHLNGQFILYHGMTNILTIGDVSLFDLKNIRLSGLGELKAKKDKKQSNIVNISLIAFGPKDRFPAIKSTPDKKKTKEKSLLENEYFDQNRFKRQLNRMSDSMSSLSIDKNKSPHQIINKLTYCEEVNTVAGNVTKNKITTLKADRSLLLAAFEIPIKKLSKRLLTPYDVPKNGIDTSIYDQIICKNSRDNTISIGTVHFSLKKKNKSKINITAGSIPLFWQDINQEVLEKIYFQRMVIVTMYNPAFLMSDLRDIGIQFEYTQQGIKVYKNINRGKMMFANFSYYIDWIKDYLHSESSVMDMISETSKLGEEKIEEGYSVVKTQIQDLDSSQRKPI